MSDTTDLPTPITRIEKYLDYIAKNGGGVKAFGYFGNLPLSGGVQEMIFGVLEGT